MCDDFNVFDADLEYKSPIDMIVQQMSSEFDQMKENQLMLKVNQAVDFNVDKDELLRALQYDREQYEKGYEDAKKKFERPKGEWEKFTVMDFVREEDVLRCNKCGWLNGYVAYNFCPQCGADMRGEEE